LIELIDAEKADEAPAPAGVCCDSVATVRLAVLKMTLMANDNSSIATIGRV
jgi:hypothetical protein